VNVRILYQTQYAYEQTVTFSPHLFRLFPKVDRHLKVRRLDFQTNLDAVVNYRRDIFDNEVASCFYPTPSALLAASFNIEIEVEERNAFGFLLDQHALNAPFAYKPAELRVLQPYLQTDPTPQLPFWKPPAQPQPTIEMLVGLNDAIHANLEYERREEGESRPSAETIALGRGACRDFSVLLADVLRGMGLAARLASGYLCEFGDTEKVAEGALHAWVETYLPGAGWFGIDPTNGTFCDHHHLTAAVGLTAADISPVLGNYYHKTHVGHQMNASLQIIPHE
jgi:transglutaminase-like putative cysteine protease